MGCGRYRRRLEERPDTAARAVVQCGQRQGARCRKNVEAAEILLELGRNARAQQERLFSLYAGDQSALRPARVAQYAARGGPRQRVQTPRPTRRSDAPRGARMGARNSMSESRRIFELAHRGVDSTG